MEINDIAEAFENLRQAAKCNVVTCVVEEQILRLQCLWFEPFRVGWQKAYTRDQMQHFCDFHDDDFFLKSFAAEAKENYRALIGAANEKELDSRS
jgi:hypothetical protein